MSFIVGFGNFFEFKNLYISTFEFSVYGNVVNQSSSQHASRHYYCLSFETFYFSCFWQLCTYEKYYSYLTYNTS